MSIAFLTPQALVALIPFVAFAIWLLRSSRPSRAVPFVRLWIDTDAPRSTPSRRVHRPPLSVVLMLLAMLLAIVAAARPAMISPQLVRPLDLVLDRGIASAGRDDAEWNAFAIRAQEQIVRDVGGDTLVHLIAIPSTDRSPQEVRAKDLRESIHRFPPTAVDTSERLLRMLAESSRPGAEVIALTNQSLPGTSTIRIRDRAMIQNVAIVRIGVADTPKPAVMVRLRNDTPSTRPVGLRIALDGKPAVQRSVELPPSGTERDEFIDLPARSDCVRVEVDSNDDVAIDNVAFAAREMSWPSVEARTPLPAALRRMIDVYGKLRPSGENDRHAVGIADEAFDASAQQAATPTAILARDRARTARGSEWTMANHPVTENIRDWAAILRAARFANAPPDGFTPIVDVGETVAVAIRESPTRAVWIGFESEEFSKGPDFVVFWANVFDWLGGSEEGNQWRSRPVEELGTEWQREEDLSGPRLSAVPTTGIFVNAAGRRTALTPANVHATSPVVPVTLNVSRSVGPQHITRSFSSALLIAALVCLLGAVSVVRR